MSKEEFDQDYPPPEDPPKVLNPPAEIYLIYGDLDMDVEHSECREVTWCEDGQFCCDVRYVRSDIYYEALERADRLLNSALHHVDHKEIWSHEQVADLAAHDTTMRGLRP